MSDAAWHARQASRLARDAEDSAYTPGDTPEAQRDYFGASMMHSLAAIALKLTDGEDPELDVPRLMQPGEPDDGTEPDEVRIPTGESPVRPRRGEPQGRELPPEILRAATALRGVRSVNPGALADPVESAGDPVRRRASSGNAPQGPRRPPTVPLATAPVPDDDPTVLTSRTSDRYHDDEHCRGWIAGRHGQGGYEIADEIWLPVSWARRFGKTACEVCEPDAT